MGKNYILIEIKKLREHEQITEDALKKLIDRIRSTGYISPIVVDLKTMTILDGHHRFNAAKALSFKYIPVFPVEYNSPSVKVVSRKENVKITKEKVIKMGASNSLYSPKTTKHTFESKPKKIKVLISELV